MRKLLCVMLAAITLMGVMLAGCVQNTGSKPDSYKGIRWVSSDYSFRFTPDDDCKGVYKFNDKKYNIQLVFAPSTVVAVDKDKNDTQLFDGQWKYEEGGKLYIYDVVFNTKAYKEMEKNFLEFIMLHKEKLEK